MTPAAFVGHALDKSFPGVRALSGVNLRLDAGSIHALLGENGAGKSTLIKIMTGVHRPDGGQMTLRGEPADFHRPLDAARAGIGAVHQERNLVPAFSVGENIMLQDLPSLRGGRVDRAAVRARARACLDELGIELDPDAPVTGLSVAQRQLVEIAKALALDSAVLLLDEPTASITADEADRLFTIVRRLAAQGRAILFVSHKLEEVFALCDTATVLRDGRSVLESGSLANLDKDTIVELMVGRAHAALAFADRPAPDGSPVLELDGVATTAGHRDVSLSLRAGEIVGLYGLVGAGRSELAKAVLGLDRITSGEVRVRGKRARIRDVGDALRRYRIGYVTENRKEEGLFLDQTVTRNVAVTVWDRLRTRFGAVPGRTEAELAQRHVDQLGIRVSSVRQAAGQLSGGNQQKVSLAKWLAAQTEILIIDEPTVGIDVRTKAAFHQLIWELAGQGLAILLISSDLPEMITLADRIVVMRDYGVQGELVNDHRYEEMSQAVIRLIHQRAVSVEAG
jgi:ribose transport system ATP-binding protein